MSGPELIGFGDSVYCRAVRIAMHEKSLSYAYLELNPFEPEGQTVLRDHHPFGRVPILRHEGFTLYETVAILDYLDAIAPMPALRPVDARAAARMVQVQSIADCYLYRPLVRQAFSHSVYRPYLGLTADPEEAMRGLTAAEQGLDALEAIATEGLVLNGRDLTRADCHIAPMIEYFVLAPDAAALLTARPALAAWFSAIETRAAVVATRPDCVISLRGPQ